MIGVTITELIIVACSFIIVGVITGFLWGFFADIGRAIKLKMVWERMGK